MPPSGNRLFDSDLKWYLIAATPITSLFCIIPFELYYTGREYWNWNYKIPILFSLAGIVVYGLILALLTVLLKTKPKIAVFLSNALFWLGLMVLLADIFVPLQTSLLDGRELHSNEPLNLSLMEAALFVMILFVAVKTNRRFRVLFACCGSVGLIATSLIYLCLILISGKPGVDRNHGNPGDTNLPGNVYHISSVTKGINE